MYPQLSEEESEELTEAVFQFTREVEYKTAIVRTVAFYILIIIIFVLLMVWIF